MLYFDFGLKMETISHAIYMMIFLSKRYNRPTERNGTKSEPENYR